MTAVAVVYTAYPYNPDYSHLRKFSAFASKVFKGDTMSAEVVRYAVNEKCAVGIGLTDEKGREIGFFRLPAPKGCLAEMAPGKFVRA